MAGVDYSTTPTDFTVQLTNADEEYAQALPEGTKRFNVRVRSGGDVRHSFVSGRVAAPTDPYGVVESGAQYYDEGLFLNKSTLYLASSTAGTVVEIRAWK